MEKRDRGYEGALSCQVTANIVPAVTKSAFRRAAGIEMQMIWGSYRA